MTRERSGSVRGDGAVRGAERWDDPFPDPSGGQAAGGAPPSHAWLLERYRAYRRRQGAALLSLIPREGVRPLYRAALEGSVAPTGAGRQGEDLIGLLADFCGRLLPLPPFEIWRDDFAAHPAAHLDEADEREGVGSEPTTVEIRAFQDEEGALWYASLDVARSGGRWRGSLAFHSGGGSRSHRTGEIFVEDDATAVRSRFLEFGPSTLRAFLRSVLP